MSDAADVPASIRWSSAGWLEEAVSWADVQLAAAGLRRDGVAERTKLRAWSCVLRIPLAGGAAAWMKACTPAASYEAALVEFLARRVPGAVPAPLSVAPDRGWLLTPDCGPVLADAFSGPALFRCWADALRRYADLQRRTAAAVTELHELGVPVLTPDLLSDVAVDVVGRRGGGGIVRPDVLEACERLGGSPIPVAIQHDDLHAYNVFADVDGQQAVFDWGDAYVGHPFSSMLIALRPFAAGLDREFTDDERRRLVAAYLEPWSDLAPMPVLEQELRDAVTVAPAARVVSWERALSSATVDEHAEWDPNVRHWATQLEESPSPGRA